MISICKGTIKFTLEQVREPRGGVTSEQERGWVVIVIPWPFYPLERPRTHCIELGGPQGRSGHVRKILSPPHTVQPVASCYTNCAIPAQSPTVTG